MKDEIKEHMQNCIDREESCLLNSDNTKILLDYITKLEQENDYLTNALNTCMIERNNYVSRNEKADELLELKQLRYLNEPEYRICTLDLQEVREILKGEQNDK